MKRLKYFSVICAFLYLCAILIDTNLNPLEWAQELRIFMVFLLGVSGFLVAAVEFDDKPHQKSIEEQIFDKLAQDIEWREEIRRGK